MKLVTILLFTVVVLYVANSVNAQRDSTRRPGRATARPGRVTARPGRATARPGGAGRATAASRRTRRPLTWRTTRRTTRRTRRTTRRPNCDDSCPADVRPVCGTVFRRGRFINCNFINQCQLDNHSCRRREVWRSTNGRCTQKSSNRDCS